MPKRKVEKKWFGEGFQTRDVLFYKGSIGDNSVHRHLAIQIVIAPEVKVESPDFGIGTYYSGVFIGSLDIHRMLDVEYAEVYLIEPSSFMASMLKARGFDSGIKQLNSSLISFIRSPEADCSPSYMDPRLEQILIHLTGPDGLKINISELAKTTGLTSSSVRKIAQKSLGMSLSKWRRWSSLKSALHFVSKGRSLVDAAHLAGFSDQAHFTNTCSEMLGLSPGMLEVLSREQSSHETCLDNTR